MEISSLIHYQDSSFSYPLSNREFFILLKAKKGDVAHVSCLYSSIHPYKDRREVEPLTLSGTDGVYDYFSGIIGKAFMGSEDYAFQKDHPYPGYTYYFMIEGKDGTKLYLTSGGAIKDMESDNYSELFLASFPNIIDRAKQNPLLGGYPVYQIFPDRFNRGKDEPSCSWMNESKEASYPDNSKFCGGDIKGIIEKLDYLKNLGIKAIYLNPINPSPTAHHYEVEDYLSLDPRLGTGEDFLILAKEMHSRDMVLCLDLVFNHCGDKNPLFVDVIEKGKNSKYASWFFLNQDTPKVSKGNYLYFGHNPKMPKLNTSNPEVISYFKEVGLFWLKRGVDGFRLDVSDEVSHAFWRSFKEACKKENPNVFLIGEEWNLSLNRVSVSEWDATMDYPFRHAVINFLLYDKGDEYLSNELTRQLYSYPYPFRLNFLNLLSSHDTPRIFTILKKNKDKALEAAALSVAYPGLPDVYYGDEIFMEGENDPGCRKYMEWGSKEFEGSSYRLFKELMNLRKHYPSLRQGTTTISRINNLVKIERKLGDETVSAFFSSSKGGYLPIEGKIIASSNLVDNRLGPFGFAFLLKA